MDEFLTKYSHPALWDKWENKLSEYAFENGKDKEWINEGMWKSRRVRYTNHHAALKNEVDSPVSDQRIRNISFDRPITDEILEFLKPFGKISKKNGITEFQGRDITIEVDLKKNEILYKCAGSKKLEIYLDKQINKYLNCVKCGGCIGSCSKGAIAVNQSLSIDEDKCVNCLSCCTSKHICKSCVAIHYKTTREKVEVMT